MCMAVVRMRVVYGSGRGVTVVAHAVRVGIVSTHGVVLMLLL